jgi:hypothetical protein
MSVLRKFAADRVREDENLALRECRDTVNMFYALLGVAQKKQVLLDHGRGHLCKGNNRSNDACLALRELASDYDEHPDYKSLWKVA